MAIQDTYLDNVFIQWNEVGGQKVVLGIDNEQKKIFNYIAVLNQIPDIATRVTIDGMFEINNNQEITLPSQFKVNYANGFVTFHPDLDNTTVTISHYAGRGIIYYPSSRIYTQMSQDGTTVEQTFQNLVDTINEYQYMGVYNNSTTYQTNQQVYYNGSTYIAISTTLGNLPTNDNYWRILSAGNNFSGDFSDIIQYYQRDCVQYNKAIYQCISKPPIGTLPTNITYWIQMVSLNDIYTDYINVLKPDILSATANANNARYKGDYNASVEYKVNNIIRYANSLYICKLDSVGNLPTDTTYWDESTKAFTWKNTFNIATNYKVFDVVEYLGSTYVCINNSTGNIPTDITYFNIMALKGEKGATLSPKGAYNNAVTYLKDDLVFYNVGAVSGVYYAKQTTIGNLPTNTAYWDAFITGGGDMNTAIYDTGNTGTVDDSKKLGGQLPSYYAEAQEIADARISAEKSKTFATLDDRLEESEQDFADHESAADPHDQYALDTDLTTLQTEVTTHKAENAHVPYGSAVGANAKTITLNPAPTAYTAGMALAFKNTTQNTGAVTINVNGLGAKSILKSNGNALSSGNLKANSIYTIRYNGSNFILQGEGGDERQGDNVALAISLSGTTLKLRAPEGLYDGIDDNVTHTDANRIASNIKKDVSLDGLIGTLVPLTTEKKWTTGTTPTGAATIAFTTETGATLNKAPLTISGLTFKPTIIIAYSPTGLPGAATYWESTLRDGYYLMKSVNNYFRKTGNFYINATGFQIPCGDGTNNSQKWLAIE